MRHISATATFALAALASMTHAQPAALPAPPVPPLHADTMKPRDISALLEPIIKEHNVPGMAAAVVAGDRIVFLGSAGVRAAGQPEKVTGTDLWHLGSCTKAMTATLCGVLVEDGKLSWNSSVSASFPELAPKMHKAWQRVTLRQLLTHRSGAPADLSTGGLWSELWTSNETPARLRLTLVQRLTAAPPTHAPDARYLYSNAGYAIAGAMAERAAGEPWESLIQRRLFTPLGITSAGFGAPGVPGVNSQPRGHRDGKPSPKPIEPSHDADNPQAIAPAGTVHMSIADWAKFVSLHLRGHAHNPHRAVALLKAETFDELHTPTGDYAGGWSIATRPWAEGRVLNHSGSNTMWFCVTWIAPKKDFAVLVCTNLAGEPGVKAADDAAGALIREYLKEAK